MLQNLKKRNKGFTIVEVMIVLAIGGMIMLIVFLAVPQLQRNSRNTARTADASRTAAAVNECLANSNGTVTSCNNLSGASVTDYIQVTDNSQLNTVIGVDPTAAQTNHMRLEFGQRCNTAGTDNEVASSKSFSILYRAETRTATGAMRCVGS